MSTTNYKYAIIVYFSDGTAPKKWRNINKLNSVNMFLNSKHPNWAYFNVYNRSTRAFIKQFKKGAFVPAYVE